MSSSTKLVEYVPMRRRHLRGVLRIEKANPGGGWSQRLFASELARPEGRLYMVALAGTEVVGYAGALVVVDEAHVTNIAVAPQWRLRGIATQLMLRLTRGAIEMGAGALTLEVRASNAAALALYRRFGLAPVGTRKSYYSDPVEDALIMWATDIRSPAFAERLRSVEERT